MNRVAPWLKRLQTPYPTSKQWHKYRDRKDEANRETIEALLRVIAPPAKNDPARARWANDQTCAALDAAIEATHEKPTARRAAVRLGR